MDLHHRILDSEATATRRQDDWLCQVWRITALFSVDAAHLEGFPHLLEKDVQAEFHVN